jgi:glutamine synthetase
MGIETLPSSLWEAYHALEEDDVIKGALGGHVYEKFMEIKHREWDDYRVRVFKYELERYLDI